MNTIESKELQKRKETITLIDVRSPAEFREKHIDGAVNIPLASLDEKSLNELQKKDQEICFMCKSGMRSSKACEQLREVGGPISMLEGGIEKWIQEGLPVEEGKKTISIQRQVLITAGSLILTGVILGYSISSTWFILSGLFGAGLLFAGISNNCLLAMLIARMPWNQ